ncbi:MAG: helix-turn-helix domain-containing protein [Pricia sp.]
MSVTEICFESGFNNFSYFNRSFKDFAGMGPMEYRKQSKKILR